MRFRVKPATHGQAATPQQHALRSLPRQAPAPGRPPPPPKHHTHTATSLHLPLHPSIPCIHPQGEAPDNMRRFWRFLLRKSLPPDSLAATRYAVFGLGDSGYPQFNVRGQSQGPDAVGGAAMSRRLKLPLLALLFCRLGKGLGRIEGMRAEPGPQVAPSGSHTHCAYRACVRISPFMPVRRNPPCRWLPRSWTGGWRGWAPCPWWSGGWGMTRCVLRCIMLHRVVLARPLPVFTSKYWIGALRT